MNAFQKTCIELCRLLLLQKGDVAFAASMWTLAHSIEYDNNEYVQETMLVFFGIELMSNVPTYESVQKWWFSPLYFVLYQTN